MKNTGSYYTPEKLADFMCKYVKHKFARNIPLAILEPSCGDGVFIRNISKHVFRKDVSLDAIEISDKALSIAHEKLKNTSGLKTRFYNCDFLGKSIKKKYDLVIGNPPYIAKKRLTDEQKKTCQSIHKDSGLKDKCSPNIWTSFVVKSEALLKEDGIMAFVLPTELLQVVYAKEIQQFLYDSFKRIEIITFDDLIFKGVGQDTIVLIAYKSAEEQGLFFSNSKNVDTLSTDISFHNRNIIIENELKWTAGILNELEIELLVNSLNQLEPISSYSSSCPGIVTAANNYFIVNEQVLKKYKLRNYAKPIIRKGQYVDKWVEIDIDFFEGLVASDSPCHLVHIGEKLAGENTLLKQYIDLGEKQGLDIRYKCSKRKPWYNIPSVWTSEAFFFKRTHCVPKLIKNTANSYVTDSAYRIQLNDEYDVNSFIYSFYNSLTLTLCELFGRFYGGGVLELTPNEFKRIRLPYTSISGKEFKLFAKTMNEGILSVEKCILKNDKDILQKELGYNEESVKLIQSIRLKLQKRRMRNNSKE